MDNRSDEELVHACCQGDREAYSYLVVRYAGRVFAICYGAVGDLQDAEDLVQEAFLKGFKEIDRVRDGGRFFPWIKRIAQNLCIDFFRHRNRGEILVADPPERGDRRYRINTDYLDLKRAIATLPERFRLPFLYYYFQGRSTKSIADVLAVSPVTVRCRLSRARRHLRRFLSDGVDRLRLCGVR